LTPDWEHFLIDRFATGRRTKGHASGAKTLGTALPPEARIGAEEVHVWRAALDVGEALSSVLECCLAPDERDRADRYRRAADRARFIAGRGILRDILARYLRVAPGSLRFSYTRYGKPHLDESGGAGGLTFNVSHSRNLALYAITRRRDVGIDVEALDRDMALMELAEKFFSPAEVKSLHAVPEGGQRHAFFRVWTRKEAYLKACGRGLSLALDRFSVSADPDNAVLVDVVDRPEEVERWRFQDLDAGEGYAAAIAVEGEGWRVVCMDWPGIRE